MCIKVVLLIKHTDFFYASRNIPHQRFLRNLGYHFRRFPPKVDHFLNWLVNFISFYLFFLFEWMTKIQHSCKDGDHSAVLQGVHTGTCAVRNNHNVLGMEDEQQDGNICWWCKVAHSSDSERTLSNYRRTSWSWVTG